MNNRRSVMMQVVIIVVIMVIICRSDLVVATKGVSRVTHSVHTNVHHHHFCNRK
jgi:hypothetical protein